MVQASANIEVGRKPTTTKIKVDGKEITHTYDKISESIAWGGLSTKSSVVTYSESRNAIIVGNPFGNKQPTKDQIEQLSSSGIIEGLLRFAHGKQKEIVIGDDFMKGLLNKVNTREDFGVNIVLKPGIVN